MTTATAITYGTVPRCWPGATIVCLATGPSLVQADVDACLGRARVIAIKHAITLAPWADVLYSCGQDRSKWWNRHHADPVVQAFEGLRYTLDPAAAEWATLLEATGVDGLERAASGLKTGQNSGYQAINLAVHLGAARIVLLGYDLQRDAEKGTHFFGEHPTRHVPEFADFRPHFQTLVAPLAALGISIVNCSRASALEAFPRQPLEEALR